MPKVKSLQQQLQEAISAGDLEKAKIIVAGMEQLSKLEKVKPTKKKSVKKKPKVKAVKKTSKAKKVVKPIDEDEEEVVVSNKKKKLIIPTDAEIIDLTGGDEDDEDGDDEDDGPEIREGRSKRSRKEEKGAACRVERMDCTRRKIEFFNGNKKEGEANEDKPSNNPALAKMYKQADTLRVHREPRKVVKAKVKCYECGKIEVISLDVAPRKGETYKCNSCVTSQGE